MDAIISFFAFIIDTLLGLVELVVLAYVVMTWLTAFEVINLRNRFVWRATRALEGFVDPLLRPFRRLLPNLGGLDFSPVLLLLVLEGVRRYLLPALFGSLHSLAGGYYA